MQTINVHGNNQRLLQITIAFFIDSRLLMEYLINFKHEKKIFSIVFPELNAKNRKNVIFLHLVLQINFRDIKSIIKFRLDQ